MQQNLSELTQKLRFPLVIKPNRGQKGRKVYVGVKNMDEALSIIKSFIKGYIPFLLEEQVFGDNYRILILNNKVVDIVKFNPPSVVGNNRSTIEQLIQESNRKKGYTTHTIDWKYVKSQGFNSKSIIPEGKEVILSLTANYSNGSSVYSINIDDVHPANLDMFLQVNKLFGLNLSGIDYIATSLQEAYYISGNIIEVNPGPGLRVHKDINSSFLQKFINHIKDGFPPT